MLLLSKAAAAQPRSMQAAPRLAYNWHASHGPPAPTPADIQREQKKAEKLIKDAAKRGDMTSAKVRFSPLQPAGAKAGVLLLLFLASYTVCTAAGRPPLHV